MEEYLFFQSACRWIMLAFIGIYALIALNRRAEGGWPSSRISISVGMIVFIILAFWMGLCPIPWDSGFDRDHYAVSFQWHREYSHNLVQGLGDRGFDTYDPVYRILQYYAGRIFNYKIWLLLLSIIYTGSYFWASIRLSRSKGLFIFLTFVAGFGFFSYGMNAIRGGLSFALIILGISFEKSLWRLIVCFLAAISFHLMAVIPAVVYIFVRLLSTIKNFEKWGVESGTAFWILCLVISVVFGQRLMGVAECVLSGGRMDYLVNDDKLSQLLYVYNATFRIDFVIFSLLPVFALWTYRYILKYRSSFYSQLALVYFIINGLWLLVIRLPYTDRSAYLSWFLMPLLLFYPLVSGNLNLRYKSAIAVVGLVCEGLLFGFII